MKLDIWVFFENLSPKFKFRYNPTRITGTLHEDVSTFMTISRWILLRMRNVSNKSYRENQNTHFIFNNVFPKIVPLWDNVEKYCGAIDHRWQYGGALHAGLVRLHSRKHTPVFVHPHALRNPHAHTEICRTYCFSMVTMVTWTRLNVTLYVHCPSCWLVLFLKYIAYFNGIESEKIFILVF